MTYLTQDENSQLDLTPDKNYFIDFTVANIANESIELSPMVLFLIQEKIISELAAEGHTVNFQGNPVISDVMIQSQFAGHGKTKLIRFYFKPEGTPVFLLVSILLLAAAAVIAAYSPFAIGAGKGIQFVGIGIQDILQAVSKYFPTVVKTVNFAILAIVITAIIIFRKK